MTRQPLSGSKLRSAGYDAREQRLEIEFADRSVRQYKGVPQEVWRRLLASPSAYAYFEDRIADEYPSAPASADPAGDARSRLDDLFN